MFSPSKINIKQGLNFKFYTISQYFQVIKTPLALVFICQHNVFSQCQKLPWKAALDRPHLLAPDQKRTTDHRAVLLTRLVQVHTANANNNNNKKNTCHCCALSSLWHSVSLGMQCIPQRAALLKSMLNFLKKAIQDPAFSDGIRHGESLASSYLFYIFEIKGLALILFILA